MIKSIIHSPKKMMGLDLANFRAVFPSEDAKNTRRRYISYLKAYSRSKEIKPDSKSPVRETAAFKRKKIRLTSQICSLISMQTPQGQCYHQHLAAI